MAETTQQIPADLNKRVAAFNAELLPLLGKYKLGLGAKPVITADGKIIAQPVIFNDTKSQGAGSDPATVKEENEASGLAASE